MTTTPADERYIELVLGPLRGCANYRPAFGAGRNQSAEEQGVTLDQFHVLYGADPLYHWLGLDSDLMYAAHKAAGGMTSIYRQLGIGCERLLRGIVRDTLGISEEDAKWSYEYPKEDGTTGTHTLDVRYAEDSLTTDEHRTALRSWLDRCGTALRLTEEKTQTLRGVVMEVRQGYKSADSKRQQADLRFTTRAYNENYLPAIVVVSSQVSQPVIRRYLAAQTAVLIGTTGPDTSSTFSFFRNVVGFDLAAFFERSSPRLRVEFERVLEALLTPT